MFLDYQLEFVANPFSTDLKVYKNFSFPFVGRIECYSTMWVLQIMFNFHQFHHMYSVLLNFARLAFIDCQFNKFLNQRERMSKTLK